MFRFLLGIKVNARFLLCLQWKGASKYLTYGYEHVNVRRKYKLEFLVYSYKYDMLISVGLAITYASTFNNTFQAFLLWQMVVQSKEVPRV